MIRNHEIKGIIRKADIHHIDAFYTLPFRVQITPHIPHHSEAGKDARETFFWCKMKNCLSRQPWQDLQLS